MSSTYDQLVTLLTERFEVSPEDITPDTTFEDLEMDSLFMVELLLVVQSEMGVRISEDSATPADTVARAAELIDAQTAAAGS
ncbi:acyl carrier protein [Nocardiopsis sp. NRRL B-16309]|uniref:acyl carrier protein n=1 Tax=Nocardiopsis sp. NRRL B-16309 TaxID=1519494 RepID=UPI0006AFF9DD|nr:phosphopantetheine-binding protein [Nocardiopsis sp. NRRL B-16309]KOX12422.1 acyl carrier protein [Nocardiopsis sp. NRRL B-16309]